MRRGALGLAVAALSLALSGTACAATPTVSPTHPSPTSTAPPGMVALSDVDPTIAQDMRYAGPHNFVGQPITGYVEPVCILTRPAAEALHRVQQAARAHGFGLKVYDCYRPQQAVDEFVAWSKRPEDQRMKAEFYPQVPKAELFDRGFIGAPTAHSRGSTMDLTLVPLPTPSQPPYVPGQPLQPCTAPVGQRFPDNSVDMGTGFDCFDPLAHTDNPAVDQTAQANRRLLRDLMSASGLRNYPPEWWHYTLVDEPYPGTYFNFPVERSALGDQPPAPTSPAD